MTYENEWGTESGLLDEYEGTVDKAYFATDLKYQQGEQPLLHLEMTNIRSEEADEVPDTIVEKLSIGSGWDIIEGGAEVERLDGNPRRKFNKNSKYGRLIDAAMKNADGAFDGLYEVLAERGSPKSASIWVGLRFRFERIEVNYGGEIGTRDFLFPVAFLGVEGEASSNGHKTDVDVEAVKDALETLAATSDTYDEFAAKALRVDGVHDDPELFNMVTTPDFYESVSAAVA